MASQASPPAVPTVTLKVNHEGSTRRFKLALRDMSATSFEDKLRQTLDIPSNASCKIERWSDSAGSFVLLDRNNPSVYKQLYRAAKAKSKLKIRVTNVEVPKQTPTRPAVTVEDETEDTTPSPLATASASATPTEQRPTETEPAVEKATQDNILDQPHSEPLRIIPLRPRASASTVAVDTRTQMNVADMAKREAQAAKCTGGGPSPYVGSHPTVDLLTGFEERPWLSVRQPQASNLCTSLPGYGDFFRVCCNSCEQTIPDVHYHCTKCDDDDFDLCPSCVGSGITCYGPDHWLIKRFKKDGTFVTSTTETLPPKLKAQKQPLAEKPTTADSDKTAVEPPIVESTYRQKQQLYRVRGCNSCIRERPEHHFVHCTTCDDYDLCGDCFVKDAHGHHPKHAFVPAVPEAHVLDQVTVKLAPGRNHSHNAICDKCDQFIRGVRHKCLDCPDWDYCSDCVKLAPAEHAGHRFAPIYESLSEPPRYTYGTVHQGICCDGPLCAADNAKYISGLRYKCVVCPDTDFCSSCEAHPANPHNKTHPLIKFKTAVRHALVSTSGYEPNGSAMPQMGDGPDWEPAPVAKAPTPTMSSPRPVVNVEPCAPKSALQEMSVNERIKLLQELLRKRDAAAAKQSLEAFALKTETESEVDTKPAAADHVVEKREKTSSPPILSGQFVKDTVTDGTVLPQNHVFEQTWVLRNSGNVAWPAGCTVKYVGGDYMGHVDSNHPAGISELVSASESTVCYDALEPGKDYPFTVLLRTPPRDSRAVSYWRLTTPEGVRFGHRLWCDVKVQTPEPVEKPAEESVKAEEDVDAHVMDKSVESSQMVFPKLEKESPVASIHETREMEDVAPAASVHSPAEAEDVAASVPSLPEVESGDDLEDWNGEGEEWNGSEHDGFLTDEEYDILDASDEEWAEPGKSLKK